MAPTPLFLAGKFHRQRHLVGYSPWGHREVDMTEHTYTPVTTGNYIQYPVINSKGK